MGNFKSVLDKISESHADEKKQPRDKCDNCGKSLDGKEFIMVKKTGHKYCDRQCQVEHCNDMDN